MRTRLRLFGLALIVSSLVGAGSVTATSGPPEPQAGTRHVTYEREAVVTIRTKVRYTTIVMLPEHEQILDWICGDRDNWVISGDKNVTYLKPAEVGAHTNLHLVTASGHIYSFLVAEVSSNAKAEPDLRVAVEPADGAFAADTVGTHHFYSAAEMSECREQVTRVQVEAKQAAVKAEEAVAAFRVSYPAQMQFPYVFARGTKPFFVEAIFHDGRFTYLRLGAAETPALYELQDGEPQLIQFARREGGMVVVSKVLDGGYLALGQQRLTFSRVAEHR